MKKNKMMRLASGLLVAVLLTTCAISGTFAKYVTAGEAEDNARVAKFGVKVTATGDMFKKEYAKDDTTATIAGNTVISTDKVVAPGTEGSLGGVAIAGEPEVAVRVTCEATTVNFGTNWVDETGAYYCPIEITVGATTIKGMEQESIDAFQTEIINAVKTFKKEYPAGTNLEAAEKLNISWKWAFEGNDDVKDTFLGDQAAAGNPATIALTVTTTVTQID